jgi:sugar lactone lactonase YvrE
MTAEINVHREVIRPQVAGYAEGREIYAYQVHNRVGEGPSWHPEQQVLFWIDVRGKQLMRLEPDTHLVTRWNLPEVVGAMALGREQTVYLAFPHRVVIFDVGTGALTELAQVELDRPANRLNDGKTSPSGRWFVFGSMDDSTAKDATGALYRLSSTGDVVLLHDGLVVCNGIAWSADGTVLYFSDSYRGLLMCAPWCEKSGEMGTARRLATLNEAAGRPDGAGVDLKGNYWSAGVSAGCINILDPGGSLIRKIGMPCRAPTMIAFGGADAKTVYVTSLVRPDWKEADTFDGALFVLQMDEAGIVPPFFGLRAT